jgi:beta-mannanase
VTAPGGVSIELSLKKLDIKTLDTLAKKFPKSAVSVGLNLAGLADAVAAGKADKEIDQLLAALAAYQRPVYLRFGVEFDGSKNKLEPGSYVAAWKYFHNRMQAQGVKNVALVWQSAAACDNTFGGFPVADWFPGDEFVDWVALSYADQLVACEGKSIEAVIQFAREHYKPVMVAANPQKLGDDAWDAWYAPLFKFVHDNSDLIRAVTYLNSDSRLLSDPEVLKLWKAETGQSFWLRGGPKLFSTLEQ